MFGIERTYGSIYHIQVQTRCVIVNYVLFQPAPLMYLLQHDCKLCHFKGGFRSRQEYLVFTEAQEVANHTLSSAREYVVQLLKRYWCYHNVILYCLNKYEYCSSFSNCCTSCEWIWVLCTSALTNIIGFPVMTLEGAIFKDIEKNVSRQSLQIRSNPFPHKYGYLTNATIWFNNLTSYLDLVLFMQKNVTTVSLVINSCNKYS